METEILNVGTSFLLQAEKIIFFYSTQKAERLFLCCGCSVTLVQEEFAVPGR